MSMTSTPRSQARGGRLQDRLRRRWRDSPTPSP